MVSLTEILQDNRFTPADLPEFEHKLYFEGERRQRYLVRFTVLMFFATVIASGGILVDSTATVIGAMLIAPLMTPIVATTAALVMGRARRAWHSLALVAAGVLGVILVSMVISLLTIQVLNFETNTQITSRVSPITTDLIVALAAGAAGAFAMSRNDVADSLPGVAISIALVPPLCVVGVSLGNGVWDDAWGAFLLFMTNCLSILLAGGGVFALLRLDKAGTERLNQVNRRKAYTIIGISILIVTIPLFLSTIKIGRDSVAQSQVKSIANEWNDQFEEDYIIDSVSVSGSIAKLRISGAEAPGTISDLGEQIETEVNRIEVVNLLFIPSNDYTYGAEASD